MEKKRQPLKKKIGNKIYEKVVSSNGESNVYYPQSSIKVVKTTERSTINNPSWFPNPSKIEIQDFIMRKKLKSIKLRNRLKEKTENWINTYLDLHIIIDFIKTIENMQTSEEGTQINGSEWVLQVIKAKKGELAHG